MRRTWPASLLVAAALMFRSPSMAWAGGTHGGRIIPGAGPPVSELYRYQAATWSLLALALGLLVLLALATQVGKSRERSRSLDLLAMPGVRRILRWRHLPLVLQVPATLVFIALLAGGLAADPVGRGGLTTTVVWLLWWPGLALLALLGARIWCLACPPAALGDWAQKLVGVGRPYPRRLRNLWVQTGLLLIVAAAFTYWDIGGTPRRTAIFLSAFTAAAVLAAVVFERRAFCRYLCPVGTMIGFLGALSPLALRPRGREAGANPAGSNAHAGPDRAAACPLFESPYAMDRNVNCNLCMACVRSAPEGRFQLGLRPPGESLWSSRIRRADEAVQVLVLYGVTFFQVLLMFQFADPWARDPARYLLALLGVAVAFPLAVHWLATRHRTEVAEAGGGGRLTRFARWAYVLVPLVWAMFLAHNLDHLFVLQAGDLVRAIGALLGGAAPAPALTSRVSPRALLVLQLTLLVGGALASVAIGLRMARPQADAERWPLRSRRAVLLPAGIFAAAIFYAMSFPTGGGGMAGAALPSPSIAFVSDRSGVNEVYVMDWDGRNVRRLLREPLAVAEAAWSPQGTGLVLVVEEGGTTNLFRVGADGGSLERLTAGPSKKWAPLWSPDGKRIAYVSGVGAEAEIYVMDADGSAKRRMTDNGSWDYPRSWSPDGRALLIETVPSGGRNIAIAVLEVDSGGMRSLTDGRFNDGDPAVSPDGRQIAFSSDRDGNREIYVMDADGRNPRRLTDDPAWDGHPYWSPDGSRILFESSRGPGGTFEILTVLANGSRLQRLTRNDVDDKHPSWSPDGTQVVFETHRGGWINIYRVNADGASEMNLTSHPSNNQHPSW